MNRPEILAPVGKLENAIAAIENGANALFVGGKLFNARQAADNFTNDELHEIVTYAKLRGVKVYVTVNVLVKVQEMEDVYYYLQYLEKIGVDAIIVQDIGIANLASKYFPKLRLHASTQMSSHSLEDVQFLKKNGFKRVVLARELQLSEIQYIIEKCDIEIETFVHGALCYSYSGQCLMSSLIGARSGNRGRCAQTCRMKYNLKKDGRIVDKDKYLLSLKDICSLEFIPELLNIGISSFKIEGRMKSPEYVASVVRTYRKYVDLASSTEEYKVLQEDVELLKGIFNRGGFSKGYYYNRGNRQMLTPYSPRHIGVKVGEVIRFIAKTGQATIKLTHTLNPGDGLEIIRQGKESVGTGITKMCKAGTTITCAFDKYIEIGSSVYLTKNHQLLKQMRQTYVKPIRKLGVEVSIKGRMNEAVTLALKCGVCKVEVSGEKLEAAKGNPVTKEQAQKQFCKLGSTPFKADKVEIEWPMEAYMPITQMNELRREAASRLEEALLKVEVTAHDAQYKAPHLEVEQSQGWAAHVTSLGQLQKVCEYSEIDTIYWEWNYQNNAAEEALEYCIRLGKSFYLALPNILRKKEYENYKEDLLYWKDSALTGFLVRTMGEVDYLSFMHKEIIVDYSLNVMNDESMAFWHNRGISRVTHSVELTEQEGLSLNGNKERIIYGHIPVMTTSQCLLRGTENCQKGIKEKHYYELEDRKKISWNVETDCEACHMYIMSYEPIVSRKDAKMAKAYKARFQFTNEDEVKVEEVLQAYLRGQELRCIKGTHFKPVL